jgi:two-component system chemotaxis response regulator CheB
MLKKIRVLVVDDSIFFRQLLINDLQKQANIELVGYATSAFDARSKIPALRPDVITMDVEMPGLSGIDFLKELLPKYPIPVILVSSLNLSVFDALAAGAVDFVQKPDMSKDYSISSFFSVLRSKIYIASRAKVNANHGQPTNPGASASPSSPGSTTGAAVSSNISMNLQNSMVIAIGASTGGTEATLDVLKRLPADMPGIVVTQHMPQGFTQMYAERLNRICKLSVKEAANGDRIKRGQVLIAPGALQMAVDKDLSGYYVTCKDGEKVNGHRPSVDVLFHSVAQKIGRNAIGIIMTGMGRDGANGLLEMRNAGAFTIGQDKESCVVYGMPMVAQDIGAVCVQASCTNISNVLLSQLRKM